jgi:hypothetical protein
MKKTSVFKKFDDTMTQLLKVPHSEIKEKLDAEKKGKKAAPKGKNKRASRLGEAAP